MGTTVLSLETMGGPVAVAVLVLVLGALVKITMEYESYKAGAERRGYALFRVLYFAPDLLLIGLGLLISSRGLNSILAGRHVNTPVDFATCFWTFLCLYIFCLLVSCLLWLLSDDRKYFPICTRDIEVKCQDGSRGIVPVETIDWMGGINSDAGRKTLLVGNTISFLMVAGTVALLQIAFGW